MSRASAARALRAAVERLEASGDRLRSRAPESVAEGVAAAWERLADPERALGRAARERLPESTGLSLASVAWGLSDALASTDAASLGRLAARMAPPEGCVAAPARLSALVLAGNVFTAAVAPITVALLARAPVLVKASRRDDVLPRLFCEALAAVDPALADACAVVTLDGAEPDLDGIVFARADVVSAFGSDRTIASLRARLSPTTAFVPHGHGLGIGWVPREVARDAERRAEAARDFALDVAAYDQRGCLSPHGIAVDGDGAAFARDLADALAALAARMPRGALPPDVGAAQLQWRGVAEAAGTLHEGDGFAVAHGSGPIRVSPGWRNVSVIDTPGPDAFVSGLAPLGAHLKCLGVAGDPAARHHLARLLPAGLAPRVCSAGRMQRPAIDALADGRPAWEGLVRFRQLT